MKSSKQFVEGLGLIAALFLAALAAGCAGAFAPPGGAATAGYSVRDFGAVGDGKTLDSHAFDAAISACADHGGGTVVAPPGTYLCGTIHLKSNIHLYLDAGATILGAPQALHAYDRAESFSGMAYQDAGHTYFHNSLIVGENLTNVSITGYGEINGGDLKVDWIDEAGKGIVDLGDKAIALKLCKNVLIRDITIYHGGHFAILVTGCDGMTIDNVTIDTDRDGMDLDCCRNTMVSNCRVNSPGDDGICPKSSFALGELRPTENLTITNCQVSGFKEGTLIDGTMVPTTHGTGRIKFGTESNGGFKNITISNCTFRDCRGLALEEVDGGDMENITISNIAMMDVVDYPIYIRLGSRNRGPDFPATGTARNIFISDVLATNVAKKSGVQIMGVPDYPIEGVRLQNIRLEFKGGGSRREATSMPTEQEAGYPEPSRFGPMPSYGVFARHVNGLEIQNFSVSFDRKELRPALDFIDVNGLTLDNVKAQVADGVPLVKYTAVRGATTRNSDDVRLPTTQEANEPAPAEEPEDVEP